MLRDVPPKTRAQFLKGRIKLSNGEIAIQWISDCKTYCVIHRIDIYPVDSVVQFSNNRGQFIINNYWMRFL